MDKFDCIIPTTRVDLEAALLNLDYLFSYLPIKKMIFIGSEEVGKRVAELKNDKIEFMNENDIYSLDSVKEIMQKASDVDVSIIQRYAGWYYQQILKFLYVFQIPGGGIFYHGTAIPYPCMI